MRRLVAVTLGVLAFATLLYLAHGSWQTAAILERNFAVGGPTVQGEDWPAPETPFDIGFQGDPREALDLPFDTVSLATELGMAPAWLIPPDTPIEAGARWAIVVHGIGGRRENGYRFVPELRDAGLTTLLISYRNDEGAPASPDGFHGFGLTEWGDLEAAVEYALSRGAASLTLVGESMGGAIVGQFLRNSERAPNVDALAFDAPAFDIHAILRAQIARDGIPFPGLLASGGMRLFDFRNGIPVSRARVTDEIVAFPGPVFISHGSADRIVPIETSDRIVEERTAPTRYLRTRAEHILSFKSDPAAYRRAFADFLEEAGPEDGS